MSAILKRNLRMQSVDKVHVRDNVLFILSLWNVVEHGRILWLCEGQLIVH